MNVVCPRCHETITAPDELAPAVCAHCGQLLALAETHVTTGSSAFQPDTQLPWVPEQAAPQPETLPETYANWDEFRTMSPAVQGELIKLAVRALPDMRAVELRSLPANLPPKVDEFGLPLATLTIPGEKRPLNFAVAMLVGAIGLLLLLVGAFELSAPRMQPLQRDGVSAYSFLMVAGVLGISFGLWHAFFRQPMLEITLWIFENGLFLQRGGDVEACGWEDVKDFRTAENRSHPLYAITTRGACRLILSAEQSPAIMPLAEYLQVKIASALFLPKLRRIFEGDPVRFGALWLDRAGVRGAVAAPWSEIERVVADEANVFVACRGIEIWRQVPLREISFLLLLLAIAHIMIEEAKRLPADDV